MIVPTLEVKSQCIGSQTGEFSGRRVSGEYSGAGIDEIILKAKGWECEWFLR